MDQCKRRAAKTGSSVRFPKTISSAVAQLMLAYGRSFPIDAHSMSMSLNTTPLDERDAHHLRRAILLSAQAVESGCRPFGAVVAFSDGRMIAEAAAVAPNLHHDWTAHSEMLALRKASSVLSWAELGQCTLYASGEPCPMCAAAAYWCNISRVVFGLSETSMRSLRRHHPRAAGIEMSCREVLSRAPRAIEILGPALEDEAREPHDRFWAAADINS
jgi:tRNA(adenine34) deaminase